MSLLVALLLASSPVHAQSFPVRVDQCQWVHGRYAIANGSMIHRIWVIGTNHVLNLDVEDEATPPPLKRIVSTGSYEPWKDRLFGDFYVCAREHHIAGHMQRVHLLRTRNLRIVKSTRP
jgi:hypothetical protein